MGCDSSRIWLVNLPTSDAGAGINEGNSSQPPLINLSSNHPEVEYGIINFLSLKTHDSYNLSTILWLHNNLIIVYNSRNDSQCPSFDQNIGYSILYTINSHICSFKKIIITS